MVIKMRNLKLFAILLLFALNACSAIDADEPELKEGRCNYNSDCKEGFTCRDTYCEDIYHPRSEIKPF